MFSDNATYEELAEGQCGVVRPGSLKDAMRWRYASRLKRRLHAAFPRSINRHGSVTA